jgi:hypothetical protein
MNRINWVGVIVATVAAFFIGFLWYGLLFEATWLELTGQTKGEDMSVLPMGWGLLQTFVTMTGLGWFIGREGSWMEGLKTGLIAAVCFALMTSAYSFIYETSPTGLLPIDWSHLLVIYAVGGAIIGGLRMKSRA